MFTAGRDRVEARDSREILATDDFNSRTESAFLEGDAMAKWEITQ